MTPSSDVAFTPAGNAVQTRHGSHAQYRPMEERGGFRTAIDQRRRDVLDIAESLHLITASADGQPDARHRGGPARSIRGLDDSALGLADLAVNRPYASTGNLSENPKALLFLTDYARTRRVKIRRPARVLKGNAGLNARLMPAGYKARSEAAILFEVSAWDLNCPQHTPQKVDARDAASALSTRDARIADLEAEVTRLKGPQS